MKDLSGKAAVGFLSINNTRTGTEKGGDYWEAAIAPGVSVGPVTLTLPVTLGFGSGKFYQRNGYAYLAAVMNFEYALPMPGNYGRWTATAGATDDNTDREVTGNSQQNDVVDSLGLGISF